MNGEALHPALAGRVGPLVVFGRPHSGTRVLAECLSRAGVFMGRHVARPYLDSYDWYSQFVFPLVLSRYFPDWDRHRADPRFEAFCRRRFRRTLRAYFRGVGSETHWGWKLSAGLFVAPVIKQWFPAARFIHILRDGRDVALSDGGYFEVTSRYSIWQHLNLAQHLRNLWNGRFLKFRYYSRALAFGDARLRAWRGIDLDDPGQAAANRYLIQMQYWMHCVRAARRFEADWPADVYEIRYEDLCRDPEREAGRLLHWAGLPATPALIEFIRQDVSDARVGKWKTASFSESERADFDRAVEWGRPLLDELGYPR
jgi:hypothetical protein